MPSKGLFHIQYLLCHSKIITSNFKIYRRVESLSYQALQLRQYLDSELAAHTEATSSPLPSFPLFIPPNAAEKDFFITSSFFRLSPLAKADILHEFITNATCTSPSYAVIRRIIDMIPNTSEEEEENRNLSAESSFFDYSGQFRIGRIDEVIRVIDVECVKMMMDSEVNRSFSQCEGNIQVGCIKVTDFFL